MDSLSGQVFTCSEHFTANSRSSDEKINVILRAPLQDPLQWERWKTKTLKLIPVRIWMHTEIARIRESIKILQAGKDNAAANKQEVIKNKIFQHAPDPSH